MTDAKTYEGASQEPLETVRDALCECEPCAATSRARALWNEIERLRSELREVQRQEYGRNPDGEFGL